ncbi:palmitoyltransferase [Sparganum proliferum]
MEAEVRQTPIELTVHNNGLIVESRPSLPKRQPHNSTDPLNIRSRFFGAGSFTNPPEIISAKATCPACIVVFLVSRITTLHIPQQPRDLLDSLNSHETLLTSSSLEGGGSARKLVGVSQFHGQTSVRKDKYYFCHVYVRHDNLCGVLFSDLEYPKRVAQTLLTKALDDFTAEFPPSLWLGMAAGSGTNRKLGEYLAKYQNPQQADSLCKLQNDVQETTEVLHKTVESLLLRGEKLDDLVSRSNDLSEQSKLFYQTAKKTNRCCTLL